jgi:hypothetical protein
VTSSGLATSIGAGKVTNAMLAGSISSTNLIGTDITRLGTITTGIWRGTTLEVTHGGTGSSIRNFVDFLSNESIGGIKQFSRAVTNTAAINSATNTIDFSQSNLAYTNAGGTNPGYTLVNIKNGGAYSLVLTRTTNSGLASFSSTSFTFKNMGTIAMTSGKAHIYSFIVVDTVVYVSMATEN